MAIRQILEAPDPRLRTISKPVEGVDDELRALIGDMFETMYDAPGIGLAAIQVGVPHRVLVMDLQEEDDEEGKPIRRPRVFVNPELYDPSEERSVYNEGCLSVPDQYAEVERPAVVHARWLDEKGERHDEKLEGILFIDHLSRLKRDMLLKKLEKARKANRAA